MSMQDIIRAVQKRLAVTVDGNPGPETWGAIHKVIVGSQPVVEVKELETEDLMGTGKKADSRSEGNIATLHPRVRPYARALIEKAAAKGFIIKVISGTRSYAKQAELYEKYKAGGPLAAPPGRSNHNFGIAFDIGVFTGSTDPEKAKNYLGESSLYDAAGALAGEVGLSWGGNWKTQKDKPHYELRPAWAKDLSEKDMVTKLAERKENSIDPFE